MKEGISKNIFIIILSFLIGCLIAYFSLQFKYFDIDFKVNVTETLLAIITACVGIFIAVNIQNSQTKKQNIKQYIQPKIDDLLNNVISYSDITSFHSKVEIKTINANTLEIKRKINRLKIILVSFTFPTENLNLIETGIEKIENKLTSSTLIENNIIDISNINTQNDFNEIFRLFAELTIQVN